MNENKLCKECQKFDYIMNRKDGVSFDVFVICEHASEEKTIPIKQKKLTQISY